MKTPFFQDKQGQDLEEQSKKSPKAKAKTAKAAAKGKAKAKPKAKAATKKGIKATRDGAGKPTNAKEKANFKGTSAYGEAKKKFESTTHDCRRACCINCVPIRIYMQDTSVLLKLRWRWNGEGQRNKALKDAWEASVERWEAVSNMSTGERSKRRLTL